MKRNFFRETVESVLIYGSVRWTLTKALEKRINENYTRMLNILNRYLKDHPNNKEIYGNIPDISNSKYIVFLGTVGNPNLNWHRIL